MQMETAATTRDRGINSGSKMIKDRIKSVRFELSGNCNLKHEHTFCPASKIPEAKLPTYVIFKVIRFLPEDYSGDIGFHNYNEPLADNRLLPLVASISKLLPHAKLTVWTNGFLLTPEIIHKLDDFKAEIMLSDYSNVDDRLNNYSRKQINSDKPCNAPFGQLLINRFGHIALCCMDWQYTVTFGDLNNETVESCIGLMDKTYKDLIEGKRLHDVCSRCNRTRIKIG